MFYRELAEAYFWASPDKIGMMTYYQARMLTCEKADLGGVQKMDEDEARKRGLI